MLPTIDPIFIILLCVWGAGLCCGWLARSIFAPPIKDRRQELPFPPPTWRTPQDVINEARRTPMPPRKPAAPPRPNFDEDPFFARPDPDEPGDIEHVAVARQMG